MKLTEFIGYDREGSIKELPTTLNKGKLGTFDITIAALGFNAPAWVAASSMSILYSIMGHSAPLTILIAYFFPMLVLALSMVYLTRQAPSSAGVFTFASKFIHPDAATVLGWTYIAACATVVPMTTLIGTAYIQAMIPSLQGVVLAKVIGTIMLLFFFLIALRSIEVTAKLASIFLIFEIFVVAGLGVLGIINPHVENLSLLSMYTPSEGGWSAIGPGVLFGVWMLANFDSTINFIEEAKVPVRTIQRSLLLVLSSAFLIYSLAAIGWQYAVPVETLSAIVENGNGGPIAAVAKEYLPSSLTWIALFVVITSAAAGMQISMSSGTRTAYRMSQEGHMPSFFGKVNKAKAPWVSSAIITSWSIAIIWFKPIVKLQWYYDVITITLVISYITVLLSFMIAMFRRFSAGKAAMASALPLLAMGVLGYIGYTAGAKPVNPDDLYSAWYIGAFVLFTGLLWVLYGKMKMKNRTETTNSWKKETEITPE
ncbi:APC family permease [Fictibacillus sp. WQ 8-8]|uniref:APC family permease n=1 Tax=Fictibacillus sp. WQ 8-8 TaxID=2938788 RepID=UPI00210F1FBB|nr:APC family permease [Fictibacillus sp. WQ 8-8]MCQ6268127.1 APC family permease [Fictibacillus sp. WQ 8-8]